METWAHKMARQIRDARERERVKTAGSLERQKLRRKLAPGVWLSLRKSLAAHCADLNRELGEPILAFQETAASEARIAASSGRMMIHLEVKYKAEQDKVAYSCDYGPAEGGYQIDIADDGKGVLSSKGVCGSPEYVAQELLCLLLRRTVT
jgi:hypothetical protein